MMTVRRETNARPVVRFNEVVQFDDEDRGCLCDEKIEVRIPLSSMEQIRWLPSVDSPPESPKNTRRKTMSPDTKQKMMNDIVLSSSPMPPRLPTRWPSNRNLFEKTTKKEDLVSTTMDGSDKI